MTTYPDTATQEMSIYGSAYYDVKMALHDADRIKESLIDRLDTLMGMMDDNALEFAHMILDEFPAAVLSDEPLPDRIGAEEVILALREIIRTSAAMQFLENRTDCIKDFGRAVGSGEYSEIVRQRGISEDVWSSAVIRHPKGGF